MSDIEIEIDGKKLQAKPNQMIIQVADQAGIYIPRFCYHKHLSIAANCRMCLVEVEKAPKPAPACATPVMAGMKVFTRSSKALAAQRAVMEFLLINHPLDCPICDQGGECELQDLSLGYGQSDSEYNQGKRSVKDENLGPLIASEMTRCIQCSRCVRFGDEIAGMRELGLTQRGENVEVRTYLQSAMQSELSGNVIDVCPVGALTSKPYRFTARPWELQQYPSIAAHDCLGSNINIHTRNGTVMRVVPRENDAINQTWLSDRDRFSYEALTHPDRLTQPLIRKNGRLQETDWGTALELAMQKIQKILNESGANQLAALASPNSTAEEFYLLQKLMRGVGSSNVDHRLRQVDFANQQNSPVFPGMDVSLSELENYDIIILVGSNIQKEQPLAATRVRKAALKGAYVVSMNMMDYDFNFNVSAKKIVAPQHFAHALTQLDQIIPPYKEDKRVCILVGSLALNHPQASIIMELVRKLAARHQGQVGILTEGANSAGGWLAGMVPHRGPCAERVQVGLDAQAMINDPRKGYLLLNVEPDFDYANPVAAILALDQADCVVALSIYKNSILHEHADVILPMAPFTETSGTYVNAIGEWQSFKGVAKSIGESRPAWKILRVLANLLQCEGFDYASSEEVRDELKDKMAYLPTIPHESYGFNLGQLTPQASNTLSRIGEIPLYANDSVVRRAKSLQETQVIIEGEVAAVRMHLNTAIGYSFKEADWVMVKQGTHRVRLPLIIDKKVPEGAVFLAGGIFASGGLPELFGKVEIETITQATGRND